MSGINPDRPIESTNCAGSRKQLIAENQTNKSDCVWVAYKAEGQVDITDIIYTNNSEEDKAITDFIQRNNGKDWTPELEKEIKDLIVKHNNNKNYIEALKGEWKPVKAQEPVKAPEINHPPVYYSGDKSETGKSKEDDIKQKIVNLAPGEKFSYVEIKQGLGFKQKNTVLVQRQEDGTLLESRPAVVELPSQPYRRAVRLNTVYNENYTQKISEDFVDSQKNQWGVVSTRYYNADGKPSYVKTDLGKLSNEKRVFSILSDLKLVSNKFKNQILYGNNGEILFEVRNDTFYNAKGKAIDSDKVWDKLNKAIEDGNLKELIQEY